MAGGLGEEWAEIAPAQCRRAIDPLRRALSRPAAQRHLPGSDTSPCTRNRAE
jgi:hypothetical protein